MSRIPTHGSLFSGIGGFDLAAQWMGWTNVFWCEREPFCQQVLSYHFPKSIGYEDITQTDFTVHRSQIDILTGGFPCQPFSSAGKQLGTADNRHLWPEMLRAIREISPRWVVGENVRGLLSWNEGLAFEQVCADLEAEGYKVQAFILPAAAVNAPHRRDRVWVVAHTARTRCTGQEGDCTGKKTSRQTSGGKQLSKKRSIANADGERLQGQHDKRKAVGKGQEWEQQFTFFLRANWEIFPTQPPLCTGDDGISARLDGVTFSRLRKDSIKAAGNAIVPQLAYMIFQAIDKSNHNG